MKPKISFITLAVSDLNRAIDFYRDGFGLQTDGVVGREFHDEVTGADGTIAFFKFSGDLLVGLYERKNLAKDAGLELGAQGSLEFALGYMVATRDEVDELLKRVAGVGAVVTAPAHMRPWGVYSGYFKDPDGHLWEVAYNPAASPAS